MSQGRTASGCLHRISQIRTSTQDKNKRRTQERNSRRPVREQSREVNYLHFQRLFHLDRGKLAKITLDDVECLSCDIPPCEIYSAFKARWETPGKFKSLGNFQIKGKADNSAFRDLIMAKEIEKNVQEISKNSAPGPDGITLRDLKKMDPEFSQTMEIFNLWLTSDKNPRHGEGMQDCINTKVSQTGLFKGH